MGELYNRMSRDSKLRNLAATCGSRLSLVATTAPPSSSALLVRCLVPSSRRRACGPASFNPTFARRALCSSQPSPRKRLLVG